MFKLECFKLGHFLIQKNERSKAILGGFGLVEKNIFPHCLSGTITTPPFCQFLPPVYPLYSGETARFILFLECKEPTRNNI